MAESAASRCARTVSAIDPRWGMSAPPCEDRTSAMRRSGSRLSAISTVAAWGMSAAGIALPTSSPGRKPVADMRVEMSVSSRRPSAPTCHSSLPSENPPLSPRPVSPPLTVTSCRATVMSERPQRPLTRGVNASPSAVGPPTAPANERASPRICITRSRSKSSLSLVASSRPRAKPSPRRPSRLSVVRPSHSPSAPSLSSSTRASDASDSVSAACAPSPVTSRKSVASASTLVAISRSERHVPATAPPPMVSRSPCLSTAAGSADSKS